MKKEAKVEYGITITKPWSKEMYAHNEEVADIVRDIIEKRIDAELSAFASEYEDLDEAMDQNWDCVSNEFKQLQNAITCYSFGTGYGVCEVLDEIANEMDRSALFRLKEIAEELDIELEKGFIGFSQPVNFPETKLPKDQDPGRKMLIFKYSNQGMYLNLIRENMRVNLAEQLNAFASGQIMDSDGTIGSCFNFYDWFCKDSSLERKANALFPKVKKFIAANPDIDILSTYVFFKNNCPMNGPLYDDFRICNAGEVLFTIIPKCGHSGKAEIWGKNAEGKFECLKQAETFSKLF